MVKALAERADILVENFRPGVMAAWGLGPKVNPDLKQSFVSQQIHLNYNFDSMLLFLFG